MQIIPVIDIKGRHVVHAVKGNRTEYAPVHSSLCKDSRIQRVVESYLSLYDFNVFYIADLDAITSSLLTNQKHITDVLIRYPDKRFWVDSGRLFSNEFYRSFKNYLPVIGSESLSDGDAEHIERLPKSFVLSLDYSANGRLGSAWIFDSPTIWPDAIVVMTLAQVGSLLGPDFEKLAHYRRRFPNKRIIAAGGIRDKEDLLELNKIGVNDVLIATALHTGALSANDIIEIVGNRLD